MAENGLAVQEPGGLSPGARPFSLCIQHTGSISWCLLTWSRRVPMATDHPLLKNLTLVWKDGELEGIDPNFTKAGSVSDKVIDFVQTCPM